MSNCTEIDLKLETEKTKSLKTIIIEQYMIKKKCSKIWDDVTDKLLIDTVEEYGSKKISWRDVGKLLNKTRKQCHSRYYRIRPGVDRGKWSEEEDLKLLALIKTHGNQWANISKLLKNRTAKQIRDHFKNCLDSNLKKNKFSTSEDEKILRLYRAYGNQWTFISSQLNGRSGDAVKNRFYSRLWRNVADDQLYTPVIKNRMRRKKKAQTSKINVNTNSMINKLSVKNKVTTFPESRGEEVGEEIPSTTDKQDKLNFQERINLKALETFNTVIEELEKETNGVIKLSYSLNILKHISSQIQSETDALRDFLANL